MISSWGNETATSPESAAVRAPRKAVMPGACASATSGSSASRWTTGRTWRDPAIASSTPCTTSMWPAPVSIVSMPALACHG